MTSGVFSFSAGLSGVETSFASVARETVCAGWIAREIPFSALAALSAMFATITLLLAFLNFVSTLRMSDNWNFLTVHGGRRGWSVSRLTDTRFAFFTTVALLSCIVNSISAFLGDNGNSFAE